MSSGFLNIHKPQGLTSFDVVRRIRRATGIKKIGHAGTLDPMATGVLVVALGRATRLIEYLQTGTKAYEATIELGVETDSLDADGSVVARREVPSELDAATLAAACESFIGEIMQVPPRFSALKLAGVPAHRRARRGEQFEPKARPVTIESISVERLELPQVDLRVVCHKGTYIRSLARDLGDALGCGAHLTRLVRTMSSPFALERAVHLGELESSLRQGQLDEQLITPLEALSRYPRVRIDDRDLEEIRHGRPITVADPLEPPILKGGGPLDPPSSSAGTSVVVVEFEGRLAAVGELCAGACKPSKVFIETI